MRQQFIEQVKARGPHGLNHLRELLQWEILAALHSAEAFKEVAFVGGTCLRLVHGLHRFSEDLDFSAQKPGQLALVDWIGHVKRHLDDCDLADVEVTGKNAGASVASVWVKFPSLLNELGASAMPTQTLGIKLEFDANPPGGAAFERHAHMIFPRSWRASCTPSWRVPTPKVVIGTTSSGIWGAARRRTLSCSMRPWRKFPRRGAKRRRIGAQAYHQPPPQQIGRK
jgi:hypothetical protein